jgi:putative aldouronate transport system permease protein
MKDKLLKRDRGEKLAPNWFDRNKKTLALLSMVAPAAIWLLLLRYLPIGGIVLAFKNYKIFPRDPTFWNNLMHSKWVGLKNFEFIFKTDQAMVAIRNTLLYNIVFIILGAIIPVAFAIMMNEFTRKFVAKAYQTMMFFPYFLSWVVVSYFLNAFIDAQYGMIPAAQAAAGKEVISWYTNTKPWPAIIIFANLWKNVGYSTVLYLAAITGIDANQYEAAAIDGASKWQQIRYVTLPALLSTVIIMVLLAVGRIFRGDFGMFYQLIGNNGVLLRKTDILDTYIYRSMLGNSNLGMTAAAGFYQSVLCFVTIMAVNALVKWIEPDYSLF